MTDGLRPGEWGTREYHEENLETPAERERRLRENYRQPVMVLVHLRMFDDTYHSWVYAGEVLGSREMQKLRGLAHAKGFRVDTERLSTVEEVERFLEQLP